MGTSLSATSEVVCLKSSSVRAPPVGMLGQVLRARPQDVSDLLLRGLVPLLKVLVAKSYKLVKLVGTALDELPLCMPDHELRHQLVRGQLRLNELVVEPVDLPVINEDLKSDFVCPVHHYLSLGHCKPGEVLFRSVLRFPGAS